MTQVLIAAAEQLADALARENAALSAMDLGRAAGMLDHKMRASDALTAAQATAPATPDAPEAARAQTAALAERLRLLAAENRTLLERAIVVQGRVIGTLVRAVPQAAAAGAPRYAADGAMAAIRRLPAMALSTRA